MKKMLILVACLAASPDLLALEALPDEALGAISGQDGLSVNLQNVEASLDQYSWVDTTKNRRLSLNDVTMTSINLSASLDVGADGSGNPGLAINAELQPFTLKSDNRGLQINGPGGGSDNTFGLFAAETLNPTTLNFSNTGGIYNASSNNARLDFDARGANWYLAQPRSIAAGGGKGDPTKGYNVLVFRNFNFKGNASGTLSVNDVKGLNFNGTISLPRIDAANNGMQLDLGVKDNVNFSNSRNFDFGVVRNATTQSHWRFGFSGDLLNADFSMRGGTGAGIGTGLGSGIVFEPRFDFARDSDANPFVLELGEPGGSSVRFGNWVALHDGASSNPSRARYDLGTLYLNLLEPGSANGLSDFATSSNSSFAFAPSFGAVSALMGANENSAALAVRDFSLQGYSRSLSFHNTVTGAQLGDVQTWSLMPTFYNLDANLLAYGSGHGNASSRHGMGMDLTLQTTGNNTDAGLPSTQGTHLLVADTDANSYLGFRNIDSRYRFSDAQIYVADPSMGFASGSGLNVRGLRLSSEDMAYDIRAGFGLGSLPDGTVENRIRDDDAIFGMRWKFGGAFTFTLSPSPPGESYIGLTSTLHATDPDKNGLYIVEPVDGTRIEWIDITGKLNLLSQHVIDGDYSDASRIDVRRDTAPTPSGPKQREKVTFATAYELAPGTGKDDVIRIGQLNLYRTPDSNSAFSGSSGTYKEGVDWKPGLELSGSQPGTGNAYTLGEMNISGGRFYGQVDLRVK